MNAADFNSGHSFAATRLYDVSGAQVTISFALAVDTGVVDKQAAIGIRESIANLLAVGFSVNAPGLEPGQEKESVGAISRREKSDGTPILDLFAPSDQLKYKLISIYLDTPEQIAAFEGATGLTLKDIPLNDADAAINRDSRNAARLLVPVRHPATAIMEPNPRYDPDEQDTTKKKPSRLFVGWERTEAARPTPPPPQSADSKSSGASTVSTGTGSGGSDKAVAWISPVTWANNDEWGVFVSLAMSAFGMTAEEVETALRKLSLCEGLGDWHTSKEWARAAIIAVAKHYDVKAIDEYTSALPAKDATTNLKVDEYARRIVATCKPESNADAEFDAIPRMADGGADPMGRKAIAAELKNEMVVIDHVAKDSTQRAHDMWIAYAPMEDSSQPLTIKLFKEDLRKIKSAGYTVEWPSAPGAEEDIAPVAVTVYHNATTGWRIESVLPPTVALPQGA